MRILKILLRLLEAVPMFFRNSATFDPAVALRICWAYVFPSGKGQWYMKGIAGFFEKELAGLVEQYRRETHQARGEKKKVIWVCWLGGEDAMPELVRLCYAQMKKFVPRGVGVQLITLENYQDYVSVPAYIEEKFRKGMISPAHFSDVLRFCLLSDYGGMWLDATVYVSAPIPEEYFEAEYFTQKISDPNRFPSEPSRAQWCGFIWAGASGNLLFRFVRDGLFQYWSKYDAVIDYIFFDYIILAARKGIPAVKSMMDAWKPNNENIWGLWQKIGEAYDKAVFEELCRENVFHKLTYKAPLKTETEDGKMTMYGHILNDLE